MTNSTIQRNHSVTIAKAIAIILMVFGHSGSPNGLNHLLELMRMPLFFVMSGYCFKSKYLSEGKQYVSKRVTGIYIPCVKWSILFLLLHNVFCSIGVYNIEYGVNPLTSSPFTFEQIIHRTLTMFLFLVPNEQLLGGYWFLHDLFGGSILFYVTQRIVKKTGLTIALLLLVAMVMSYFEYELYYLLYTRTVLAACFIAIGYLYKDRGFSFEKENWFIACSFVILAIVSLFWSCNMLDITFCEILPYVFLAMLGSLMIFGLGDRLKSMPDTSFKSFLIFVGSKTFNILTWHMISFKLVSIVIIYVYGLPWNRIAEFPIIMEYASKGWFVVYFVVGVAVPVVWSFYYDNLKLCFLGRK